MCCVKKSSFSIDNDAVDSVADVPVADAVVVVVDDFAWVVAKDLRIRMYLCLLFNVKCNANNGDRLIHRIH